MRAFKVYSQYFFVSITYYYTLNMSRGHKFIGWLGRQLVNEVFQANLLSHVMALSRIAAYKN